MYEIELKAHVQDRKSLLKTLSGFAEYSGTVRREDTYYAIEASGRKISARIRQESKADTGEIELENPVQPKILLTYKRKELKTGNKGVRTEVNDEKECSLSSQEALECLLLDTGYRISHTKVKTVIDFKFENATIEVCTVEKLGDFIEIEILSPSDDAETVAGFQQQLRAILARCGISESEIEERYYSDMLRELESETD